MHGSKLKVRIPKLQGVANKRFNSIFNTPLGKDIFGFLCLELTVIRMIDASNLRRPAVEPISNDIYLTFKNEFDNLNAKELAQWKQYIGYMVKPIMEENGYIHSSRSIKILFGNFFESGSKYKKFANI